MPAWLTEALSAALRAYLTSLQLAYDIRVDAVILVWNGYPFPKKIKNYHALAIIGITRACRDDRAALDQRQGAD